MFAAPIYGLSLASISLSFAHVHADLARNRKVGGGASKLSGIRDREPTINHYQLHIPKGLQKVSPLFSEIFCARPLQQVTQLF